MKQNVYSIYDSKAEVFNPPIFLHKDGEAIRAFDQICNDPESDFNKWPGDYTLFRIGEWDNETGLLTPLGTPKSLGLAQSFIKKEDE